MKANHTSGVPRNRSLVRAFRVLDALAEQLAPVNASVLAQRSALPQPTIARLLATLTDVGAVVRDDEGLYAFGPELVRLGRAAAGGQHLMSRARPILERLAQETRESVTLAIPRSPVGLDVIAQIDAVHLIGVANWIGRSFPLHASAFGKLALAELDKDELSAYLRDGGPLTACTRRTIVDPTLLRSELEQVKRQGYAESLDELEEGLSAVAAPVRDRNWITTALVGVSGPSFRLDSARAVILKVLLAGTRELGGL